MHRNVRTKAGAVNSGLDILSHREAGNQAAPHTHRPPELFYAQINKAELAVRELRPDRPASADIPQDILL